MNNFLANSEHTLTDDEVEMIAGEQFPDPGIHILGLGLDDGDDSRRRLHPRHSVALVSQAHTCSDGLPCRRTKPAISASLYSGDVANALFDAIERRQLADLFDELGPDAPTLLDPWTTRDLASHLVLREHDYLAAPGLVLPGAWGRFAERRRTALARKDFPWLVATIRSGPPRGFFRIGWVRRFPNLNEVFVHHEDVRRANGRGPRMNSPAMDAALRRNVSRAAWFLARRLRGAGLELQWAGTAHTVRARRGEPTVRIAGLPGELLLYLFGRQRAADVEVSGPVDAVTAVRRARFGM